MPTAVSLALVVLVAAPSVFGAPTDGVTRDERDLPVVCPLKPEAALYRSLSEVFLNFTAACQFNLPPGESVTMQASRGLDSSRVGAAVVWDGRNRPAAGCPGGCAYILGGIDESGAPAPDVLQFNAVFGVRVLRRPGGEPVRLVEPVVGGAAVWDPRDRPAAGCPGGCAYLIGGALAHSGGQLASTAHVQRLNPDLGTAELVQRPAGPLALPGRFCCASAVWTGTVAFVFGGLEPTFGRVSNDIIRFDPVSGTAVKLDQPNVGLFGGPLVKTLPDGCERDLGMPDLVADQMDPSLGACFDAQESAVGRLPVPLCCSTAVWDPTPSLSGACRQGCAYVFGGAVDLLDASASLSRTLSNRVVRFDPMTAEARLLSFRGPCERAFSALSDADDGMAFSVMFEDRSGLAGTLCSLERDAAPSERCETPTDDANDGVARLLGIDARETLEPAGQDPTAGTEVCVRQRPPPTMPAGRCCLSSFWDARHLPDLGCPSGCAYILGGLQAGPRPLTLDSSGVVLRYNPERNELTSLASPLQAPRYYASTVWDGERAFVVGGTDARISLERVEGGYRFVPTGPDRSLAVPLRDVLVFEPHVERVRVLTTGPLPTPRTGAALAVDPSSPACPGGCVHAFGGWSGGWTLDEIVSFGPTAGRTPPHADLHLPHRVVGASAVWVPRGVVADCPEGCAYLFGGFSCAPGTPCRFLDEIARVRFDEGGRGATVLPATHLPRARWGTAAVWATAPDDSPADPGRPCSRGCAYVVGGRDGMSGFSDDIVRFDPVAGTAVTLETLQGTARLPTPREGVAAVWIGPEGHVADCAEGCMFLFGGFDGSYRRDILRVQPRSDGADVLAVASLRPDARLPIGRAFASASWDGSRVFVMGGETAPGRFSSDITWFLPHVNLVRPAALKLPSGRCCGGAGALGEVSILVGGWDASPLDQAAHYDGGAIGAVAGPSRGAATVVWRPAPVASGAVAAYVLYHGESSAALFANVSADVPVASFAAPKLRFNHTYGELGDAQPACFLVQIRFAAGAVDEEGPTCTSTPRPPGAPLDLDVKAPDGQLRARDAAFTWSPPAETGGLPITRYVVRRISDGVVLWGGSLSEPPPGADQANQPLAERMLERLWINRTAVLPAGPTVQQDVGLANLFHDERLDSGVRSYRYCVRAENEVGPGPESCADILLVAKPEDVQPATDRPGAFDDRDADGEADPGEELVAAPELHVEASASGRIRVYDDRNGNRARDDGEEVVSLYAPLGTQPEDRVTVFFDENGNGARDENEPTMTLPPGPLKNATRPDGSLVVFFDHDGDDAVDGGERLLMAWPHRLRPLPWVSGTDAAVYVDANRDGQPTGTESLLRLSLAPASGRPVLVNQDQCVRRLVWDENRNDAGDPAEPELAYVRRPGSINQAQGGPEGGIAFWDDRNCSGSLDPGEEFLVLGD